MNILIITSCFAPRNVIGAIRLSKIAKYLVRARMDVTVISPIVEDYELKDETLECPEFDKITRITIPYGKIVKSLIRKYKTDKLQNNIPQKKTTHAHTKYLRMLFNTFRDWDWSKRVIKKLKEINLQYDVIISSSPLTCTHDIAKYLKTHNKAKLWLADFRDPIVQESASHFELFLQKRRQLAILCYADIATIVTISHAKNFYCNPKDHQKVHYLSNGFDEDDKVFMESICNNLTVRKNKLVFSYTGGLYNGNRDCTPLFSCLFELISENIITIDKIQIDYAGNDFQILYEQAEKYNIESCLINHGMVSRIESIQLQYTSDFVIVATY